MLLQILYTTRRFIDKLIRRKLIGKYVDHGPTLNTCIKNLGYVIYMLEEGRGSTKNRIDALNSTIYDLDKIFKKIYPDSYEGVQRDDSIGTET